MKAEQEKVAIKNSEQEAAAKAKVAKKSAANIFAVDKSEAEEILRSCI